MPTTDRKNLLPFGDFQPRVGLSKTFGTIRSVTSTIKSATVNVAANATSQVSLLLFFMLYIQIIKLFFPCVMG